MCVPTVGVGGVAQLGDSKHRLGARRRGTRLAADASMVPVPLLVGALVSGLAGSPHCIAMCGPLVGACGPRPAAWQVGRLGAYVTLGAVAGQIGSATLLGGPLASGVAVVLLCWFAARLAGLAPALPFAVPGYARVASALLRKQGLAARLAFGAMTALMPCGLVWSALAVAVAGGSALAGGAAMAAFWLGGLPLLTFGARGVGLIAQTGPWGRRAVAIAVLVAGLWSIRVRSMPSDDGAPACHHIVPAQRF